MSKTTGLTPGTLKSMIRKIDNRIAYRQDQIESNREIIRTLELEREELAEALAVAETPSEDDE